MVRAFHSVQHYVLVKVLVSIFKIKISWNLYSLKLVQHTAWFIIESAEKYALILTVLALKGNSTSLKSIGWVLQGKLVSAVQAGFTHLHLKYGADIPKGVQKKLSISTHLQWEEGLSAILRNVGHFPL